MVEDLTPAERLELCIISYDLLLSSYNLPEALLEVKKNLSLSYRALDKTTAGNIADTFLAWADLNPLASRLLIRLKNGM